MNIVEELRDRTIVAVVRAPDPTSALAGADALVRGGVSVIEVTYSTPEAPTVIARLRERYGDDAVVGAGTVTTKDEVQQAVECGAQFLVSPGTDVDVAAVMRASGTPFALGAMTPSEVMLAHKCGADIVKIFPGSVGGPDFLKALRGPFPHVPLMPTGGVSVANAREWLDAGAVCLGAGSDLVSNALLAAGDWVEIERRAAAFTRAVG